MLCKNQLHELKARGKCNECIKARQKRWRDTHPEHKDAAKKRFKEWLKTEKGKAYRKRQLKRLQKKKTKIAAIKRTKALRRTVQAADYIRQARMFINGFLKCWRVSNEGAVLPKESLQPLHELREKAQILTGLRVSQALMKKPLN